MKNAELFRRGEGPQISTLDRFVRLFGMIPSGIGYSIERAELIAKDNKYQLKDSFFLC